MEREEQARAIAQWVAQHRGSDSPRYIAEQIARLAKRGELADMELWQTVAAHFERAGVNLPV